ncbi:MAG: sterol desaturase family protein [Dokdonella sp.]
MLALSQFWTHIVAWLSDHAVVPCLTLLHLNGLSGDPHEIAEALLIGLIQVGVIGLVLRPLESFAPAERWGDRTLTGIDRQYTLLMLLGLNPLFAYLVLTPLANWIAGGGQPGGDAGSSDSIFSVIHWLPGLEAHPLLLFLVYYLVYDLVYYWMHRTQHALPWWWALHSMHHSQRQMSCWTNDRGSYLDGFLQSMVLATVGLAIGVDPVQFALLMFIGELMQNLSHTNVRFGFGRIFEKIFVDPKFHRLHHMRVDPERPTLHNCNYGQVLTIWDSLFGTALFGEAPRPTGVGDPTVDTDNGRGLIAMQWHTLKRFWGAFRRPAGWKLGDVAFDENYAPIPTSHMDLHAFDPPTATEPTPTINTAVPAKA